MYRIALLLIATLLAACSSSPTMEVTNTGTVIPAKRESGGYIAGVGSKVYPDVEGSIQKFSNRTVAIPYFRISFDKQSGASASDSTGFGSQNVSSTHHVTAKLLGLSDDAFDRITDAAYNDLVQQLEATGYRVIPSLELLSRGPLEGKSPTKGKTNKKLAVRYGGTKYYPNQFKKGLAGMKLLKEFNAGLLELDYTVNFAALGVESRAYSSGVKGSTTKIGQVAHVLGGMSVIGTDTMGCVGTAAHCTSGGRLSLGQYTYSTTPFAELQDKTSGWANFLVSLIGGATADFYEFQAEDAKYEKAALEALKEANRRLISNL